MVTAIGETEELRKHQCTHIRTQPETPKKKMEKKTSNGKLMRAADIVSRLEVKQKLPYAFYMFSRVMNEKCLDISYSFFLFFLAANSSSSSTGKKYISR